MPPIKKTNGQFTLGAYPGDAKVLLSFDMTKAAAKGLAGFTIEVQPGTNPSYYVSNTLQYQTPSNHAQDASQPPTSTLNAPWHQFRYVHIPGTLHQGTLAFRGTYHYTVTPRYSAANGDLLPLDKAKSVTVDVDVVPFTKGNLEVGFTRGYMQSQGFVHHFGPKAHISPPTKQLLFDTSQQAGANAQGDTFTYADIHQWMGFTAREKVLGLLDDVRNTPSLKLDALAYDLNEPEVVQAFIDLAKQGRFRLILDDATLHHDKTGKKNEDQVEALVSKAGAHTVKRGRFAGFAHDKILIVSDAAGPKKVLTGSTNFSLTGMYVNSNHVVVFNDPDVAKIYSDMFEQVWKDGPTDTASFQGSALGKQQWPIPVNAVPNIKVSFAPHAAPYADSLMTDLAGRVTAEGKATGGSVLFAVMDLGSGSGPVRPALIAVHKNASIFSYGISDSTVGDTLYKPGTKGGILVTGKPINTVLPPPFSQVPGVGLGHQVHHKFVICGFNTPNAVVYCGSSNLANGGETNNGDNLIEIHDSDVATAFAIEALLLVDHFNFLDKYARASAKKTTGKKKATVAPKAPANKQHAANDAAWFLSPGDSWTKPYYDPKDLKFADRQLFG